MPKGVAGRRLATLLGAVVLAGPVLSACGGSQIDERVGDRGQDGATKVGVVVCRPAPRTLLAQQHDAVGEVFVRDKLGEFVLGCVQDML